MRDSCGTGRQYEKRKRFGQPRQAKGEWAKKALFALGTIKLLTSRGYRCSQTGETLKSETYECGSPPAPRKASNPERKSTTFKSNNEQLKKDFLRRSLQNCIHFCFAGFSNVTDSEKERNHFDQSFSLMFLVPFLFIANLLLHPAKT